MSSQATTQPRMYETILSPYPPNSIVAPGFQKPVGFVHLGNQAQSGQPPFLGSPGIITNSQQGQGNTQVVNPAIGTAITNFREEAKILGAIQIMIGLMHIGFGTILGFMNTVYGQVWGFASLALISGYPFWGGISFIATGTLSILASKKLSPSLVKSSLGMNIVSTFFAFIGVILLLVDVSINGLPNQNYWAVLSGKGIAAMLIIFSLLEFCTNCTTAYFAKRAITKTNREFKKLISTVHDDCSSFKTVFEIFLSLSLMITACIALPLFLPIHYYHAGEMDDQKTENGSQYFVH